jgi:hypothetical protein
MHIRFTALQQTAAPDRRFQDDFQIDGHAELFRKLQGGTIK